MSRAVTYIVQLIIFFEMYILRNEICINAKRNIFTISNYICNEVLKLRVHSVTISIVQAVACSARILAVKR